MKKMWMIVVAALLMVLTSWTVSFALEKEFDSAELIKELEETLKLSSEKLSELKPLLDARSKELKGVIDESMEQGFLQIEEFNRQLDTISRDAESKVRDFLSSDEYLKFKEYMRKFDRQAVEEAKQRVVDDLTGFLELTEEQITELQPVLESTVEQLNEAFTELAVTGSRNWEVFRERYKQLLDDLGRKMNDYLDREQLEKFDKYKEQKLKTIQANVIEV